MLSIVSIHLAVTATVAKKERERVVACLGEGKNQEKSAQIVCKFKKIESVLA